MHTGQVPPLSCVTLGRDSSLSDPRFPYLYNSKPTPYPQRLAVIIKNLARDLANISYWDSWPHFIDKESNPDDELVTEHGRLAYYPPHAGFGPDHIFFGSH